ncbi:Phage antirepressor protein [Propionibacterium freudenreichii]|uniref:BRO family protein n=1 Tax=Propionibacterium freudenreichii TaxID=1744 RepID=UPI00054453A5|nr:BRO family protein [Propionibacterium freudenreichii]CEG89019.1 Phage antirepressor protein [Propionibacterium freudenreichii]
MSVIPFDYSGQQVRFIDTDDGEPEIVATDLAKVLGYASAKDMVRSIDPDEKGGRLMPTLGGDQHVLTLTEAGMYQAILQRQTGRMANAEQRLVVKNFQRWVTHEVIPSIRKRGMYATPDAVEAMLADPDVMIRTLTELKAQRARVAQLQPKADYVDAFVADEDLRLLRNVAKSIGVQEGALRDALLAHEWIYAEESSRWSNSQGCKVIEHRYSPRSDKARYFRPVPNHQAPRFKGEVMHTLKVTPAGAEAISKMAKRWGLVAQEVAA